MLQNIELLVVNERQESMRRDGDRYRLALEANWQPGYSRLFQRLWANVERLISAASVRQTELKIIADQPPSSSIQLPENSRSSPTNRLPLASNYLRTINQPDALPEQERV